jgi:hypothetical protein
MEVADYPLKMGSFPEARLGTCRHCSETTPMAATESPNPVTLFTTKEQLKYSEAVHLV